LKKGEETFLKVLCRWNKVFVLKNKFEKTGVQASGQQKMRQRQKML
jgi:hypothetical protein